MRLQKRTQRLGVVEHLLEEGDVEVVEPLAATDLFLQVERARQTLLFEPFDNHRRQPGLGPIQIRFVHPDSSRPPPQLSASSL